MKTPQPLSIAIATLSLLATLAAAADNPPHNDYVLVATDGELPNNSVTQQLVTVQAGTARAIEDARVMTLFGTNGTEAGIIEPLDTGDLLTLVDLHDLSHVTKIPVVGARTVPIHTSPNQSLIISDAAIFFTGVVPARNANLSTGANKLIRLDRKTHQTTAFEIPRSKSNLWNANISRAGNHIVFPTGQSLEIFSIQQNAFIASVPCKEESVPFVYIDGTGIFQCGPAGIDQVSTADFKTPEKPRHVDVRGKIRYALPTQLPDGPAILSLAAFSVTAGKLLYQLDIPGSLSPPVVAADGHTLYLCDFDKLTIRKFSTATGASIGDDVLPEKIRKPGMFWLIGVAQ